MISHLANIHPNVRLGKNVKIDPFATVLDNVEIGDDTWIGPYVTIMENTRIGKNCKIFPGAVISAIPQDLKFKGELTETFIGDHVTIREYVTINRGTKDKYSTHIGDNCLLMAYTHVAHDCVLGHHCILANNVNLAGHIEIGDYVILGGLVAAQQFVRFGDFSYVGGGCMVRKDVPPYIKAAREPMSYAGVNAVGMRRRGFTTEEVHHIQDIYRIIFVRKYNTAQAIKIISNTLPDTPYKEKIIDFIVASNTGIIRGI